MDFLLSQERMPSLLAPFFTLSYPVATPTNPDSFPNATYYDIGYADACFAISLIALFAVLRDGMRLLVLEPFARWKLTRDWRRRLENPKANVSDTKSNGHVNGDGPEAQDGGERLQLRMDSPEGRYIRRSMLRFGEQGWLTVYTIFSWSMGLYVNLGLPRDYWSGYPHIPLPGPVKMYYMMQTAFYLHLTLVINAEARRKDHWQMLTHHIITVTLIILSYTYNFTRVGCWIMFLMDLCDILLPAAKLLRYLGLQMACDIMFGLFLISWIATRHVLFIAVIVSAYSDAPRLIPFDWIPERGYYLTHDVYVAFVSLLVSLEFIQCGWSYTIFRIAYRVVTGTGAEDERSDEDQDVDVKKER